MKIRMAFGKEGRYLKVVSKGSQPALLQDKDDGRNHGRGSQNVVQQVRPGGMESKG
jgi:hypothetical protein